MGTQLVKANGGPTALIEQFGGREIQMSRETASEASAAQAQAEIQARYIMAERHPRKIENFRVILLKECDRPRFAEMAIYKKPVGKKKDRYGKEIIDPKTNKPIEDIKEGPSIRLIEVALQHYKNVLSQATVLYENDEIRIDRIGVTDLENNVTFMKDIAVPKRVERRGFKKGNKVEPPSGRTVISERQNSYGDVVYLVQATDDEVRIKESALTSIEIRNNGRRLLPQDIIEEAMDACRATAERQDAQDPNAAKRKVIDSFATLDLLPSDLEMLLGHSLDRISPPELALLRGVFVGIRDGEATWDEVMASHAAEGSTEAAKDVAEKKILDLQKQQEKPVPPAATSIVHPEGTEFADEGKQMDLLTAAQDKGISQKDLRQILIKHGCDKLPQIPIDVFSLILADVNTDPAPRTEEKPKLTFGGKKGAN
jgi:hypothetical protein